MDHEAAPTESATGCFVFAGVELDANHCSLRVDGQVVNCSRKAFELLLQLCVVSHRVQSRDELIAALWPGGQIVSDEALTQVIFRARAVLGRHASTLLTVRGVGLRLSVPVTRRPADRASAVSPTPGVAEPDVLSRESGDGKAPVEPAQAVAATAPPVAISTPHVNSGGDRARPRRRRWLAAFATVLAAVVATTLVAFRPGTSPAAVVDEGYGLFESDLHGQDPRTATWIRDALKNESQGERDRGEALLQAVHQSDATTPIPAAFLALWSAGTGKGERASEWLALAKQRAQPLHDVYINLLLGYIEAEASENPDVVLRHAGALLDIRPQAWRMRLARAHLMIVANLRTAALHEIQQIDVPSLENRKFEMVIADRASLGDIDGAQALLDRLPQRDDAAYAWLRGRLAWSRRDFDGAYLAYRRCVDSSVDSARLDLRRRALVGIAAIDVMRRNDDGAVALLEQARLSMGTAANPASDFDSSLFLAELHARAGNHAAMHSELDRAVAAANTTRSAEFQMIAALAAARLRPKAGTSMPTHPDTAGEALWRARAAWNAGQREAAVLALTDADRRGAFNTRMVEEARYLAWQLGQPVPAERPHDPPFPPLAVSVLRRDLRDSQAAPGQ